MTLKMEDLEIAYQFIVSGVSCPQISKMTGIKLSVVRSRLARTTSSVWVRHSVEIDGRISPPQGSPMSARKNKAEWADAIKRAARLEAK